MYKKLDFDLLKQRKITFQGREFLIREKTVRDEMCIVRGFREDFLKLISESQDKGVYERKCTETRLMADVIRHFCDIEDDVLYSLPVKTFNSVYFGILGSHEFEAIDANAEMAVGEFIYGGKTFTIKTPSVSDMLEILKITESAKDDGGADILIGIASPCVEGMEWEEFYNMSFSGLTEIAGIVLDSVSAGVDEKN